MPWREESDTFRHGIRFVRSDGAAVKYEMGPLTMDWIAFKPDPSQEYLDRRSKRGLGWPRRWKTAEAAMRAVDKEYPEQGPGKNA